MSTLAIGKTLLGGKYRIERVLGQGGFGITYLACHTMLDKRVAIKEFFPQSFCNRDSSTSRVVLGTLSAAELVERFRLKFIKEARNISRLSHSAIVQIHDIFEENDTAYYVMDYIEGESLSALVRREGPLASARALHLVRCVGDALSYIHGLKMNHLDVKPANIMLSQATGQPTLIDFGLAKQYDEGGHQTTSTPVGISHGYAPMEQYNIGGVSLFSPETDIYALGATLYYLLSGETPTEAPKLINEELTFPATIPANLIAPIRRAMSPAKRDRYSSVADFLQALETPAASAEEPETSFDEPADEATVVDETPKSTPKPTPKPAPQPKPQPAPVPAPPKKRGGKRFRKILLAVVGCLVLGGVLLIWKPWMPKAGEEWNSQNNVKAVDLGLSVKWATCNVGASSASEYGNYYTWDKACAGWSGSWRVPTKAEFQELIDKCTWTWTSQGGHNGYKVTGKNGNSIFLPAAGLGRLWLNYAGEEGLYWSSTPDESDSQHGYCLYFYSGNGSVVGSGGDYDFTVRPVTK